MLIFNSNKSKENIKRVLSLEKAIIKFMIGLERVESSNEFGTSAG